MPDRAVEIKLVRVKTMYRYSLKGSVIHRDLWFLRAPVNGTEKSPC